jgi:hypothetical protein
MGRSLRAGRTARAAGALTALFLCLSPAAARSSGRVVAVGDLHGNVEAFTSILRETGLVDESLRWTGGDTTLVQMGDIVDRAPRLREILDLLMRLETEAETAGGKVVVLLGNHEIMDLLGVLREVDLGTYAAFPDEQSEQRRKRAWQELVDFSRARTRAFNAPEPQVTIDAHRQWLAAVPLGMVEFLAAFGPDGVYGRWLRNRPALLRIGDTVFVHGGLGPSMKGTSLDEIERRVHEELATFDHLRAKLAERNLVQPTSSIHVVAAAASAELERAEGLGPHPSPSDRRRALRAEALRPLSGWESWFIADPSGPLWNGAPSVWDETEDAEELAELLDSFGVARMVVGHIPRSDGRIACRFDGRLLLIDTLMEHWPHRGAPSALEIQGGTFTAVYLGERELLISSEPAPRPDVAIP